MGMSLDTIALALPEVELGPLDWPGYLEYLQVVGAPAGLLSGADPRAFHILVARRAGENVATAIAFDHDGDCGIYNMSTLETARREGSAPRSPHVTSTTPPGAAARPRACNPPRWPNASTRQSASALSAGSSSTCRNTGARRWTVAP